MARVQWLVLAGAWLLVAIAVVRTRARHRPDRRLLAALETLRGWAVVAEQETSASR